jgi:hypothetical protein
MLFLKFWYFSLVNSSELLLYDDDQKFDLAQKSRNKHERENWATFFSNIVQFPIYGPKIIVGLDKKNYFAKYLDTVHYILDIVISIGEHR